MNEKFTKLVSECVYRGLAKNDTEFSTLCGFRPSEVSEMKSGKRPITPGRIEKIVKAFPKVDPDYLRDPEYGQMFLNEPTVVEGQTVLVLPYGARGGTIADFADSVHAYDCERLISPIKGADYAMEVTGDSMSPEYPSGSRVIIKKVNEAIFVEWGKVYVLDTDNGALIKQVRKTQDPGVVECVSLNPAYQPFTLNTEYIHGWYRVMMVMSLK